MSDSMVLDILFVAIMVLIALLGSVRGPVRELTLTAGILLGAEIGLWWSRNWGTRIADHVDIRAETAIFLSAMAPLLFTSIAVGYAGGTVLGWDASGRWYRLFGFVLGAANGALLISLSLRFFYLSYAGTLISDPLNDTVVAHALWRRFDWFILVVALSVFALLLVSRWIGKGASPSTQNTGVDRIYASPMSSGRNASYSQPVPGAAIPSTLIPGSAGPAASLGPGLFRSSNGGGWPEESAPGSIESTTSPAAFAIEENQRSFQSKVKGATKAKSVVSGDDTAVSEARSGRKRIEFEDLPIFESGTSETPAGASQRPIRFCRNCGMTIDGSDRFCPDCGFHA